MEEVSELDHHFDLDPTTIWSEFPDAPAPPPLLAAGYGLSAPPSYGEFPPGAETPHFVEVIFYPSYESETGFSWPGPDPLHHGTSANDIFLYASAFLLLEQVHSLELRLCGLNEVNEVTEQFLFFVPRFETVLGNLNRVKGQINDVITRQGHGPSKRRYQLHIYPWQESGFIMATRSAVPILNNHPTLAVSILDPQFFVQNIVGGFAKSA